MFVFGTAGMPGGGQGTRGAYKEVWLNGSNSRGTALITEDYGEFPAGNITDSYFITNVAFVQKERFSVVQCFNDKNYIYAFGHDPLASMVTVDFTVFMGSCDGANSLGLGTLLAMYSVGRLTQSLKPAKVRLGMANILVEGFIVGMATATYNPEFNLQSFQVNMLLPSTATGGG